MVLSVLPIYYCYMTNVSKVVKATKVLVLVLDAALKPVSSPELCDLAH